MTIPDGLRDHPCLGSGLIAILSPPICIPFRHHYSLGGVKENLPGQRCVVFPLPYAVLPGVPRINAFPFTSTRFLSPPHFIPVVEDTHFLRLPIGVEISLSQFF